MSLLAELLWNSSTGLIYDSVNSITGEVTTNTNRRELYDREIRGQTFTVMSQPHPFISNRSYDRINLSSVLTAYTTWTLEFLMRVPRPTSTGAIITFTSNNAHWRVWSGRIDDGLSAVGYTCPDNKWVVVTLRCNGSICQMYYDDVYQGDMSVRTLNFANYINIGAFSVSYHSNIELARVRIWDEYLDVTGNTAIDSDWQSDDTISGSFCMEELDSGETSLVDVTSDTSVSISFPGVVCWGCLMGPIRNSYDFRAIINRDTFILGTGHISTDLQLLSTFRGGSRSAPCAIISATMDTDYLTVLNVRARLYDSSGTLLFSHIFNSGFNADTNYSIRLGRDDISYYFMFNNEEVVYLCDVVSTEDQFMMGLNLGPHYGSTTERWEIRYSSILINQTPAISGIGNSGLEGALSASPSLSGALDVIAQLSGYSSSDPSFSGTLQVVVSLIGLLPSVPLLSGVLTIEGLVENHLQGILQVSPSLTGSLIVKVPLVGTLEETASLVGDILVKADLSGILSASPELSGVLIGGRTFRLEGITVVAPTVLGVSVISKTEVGITIEAKVIGRWNE